MHTNKVVFFPPFLFNLFFEQTDLETIDSTDSEGERRKVRDEAESRRNQQLWIEREKQAQIEFKAKKDREERERIRKEETEVPKLNLLILML